MTKLVFDKSTGKLTGFGKSWNATSGTSSINPLANKTYTAPAHALMTGTKKTVSGERLGMSGMGIESPSGSGPPVMPTGVQLM